MLPCAEEMEAPMPDAGGGTSYIGNLTSGRVSIGCRDGGEWQVRQGTDTLLGFSIIDNKVNRLVCGELG